MSRDTYVVRTRECVFTHTRSPRASGGLVRRGYQHILCSVTSLSYFCARGLGKTGQKQAVRWLEGVPAFLSLSLFECWVRVSEALILPERQPLPFPTWGHRLLRNCRRGLFWWFVSQCPQAPWESGGLWNRTQRRGSGREAPCREPPGAQPASSRLFGKRRPWSPHPDSGRRTREPRGPRPRSCLRARRAGLSKRGQVPSRLFSWPLIQGPS